MSQCGSYREGEVEKGCVWKPRRVIEISSPPQTSQTKRITLWNKEMILFRALLLNQICMYSFYCAWTDESQSDYRRYFDCIMWFLYIMYYRYV